MPLSRRDFMVSTVGLAALGVAEGVRSAVTAPQSDEDKRWPKARPMVIASDNGLQACQRAMEVLNEGGDPVDAVVAGVNLVEDDPNDQSVGLGGLPNEDGLVELDACVMHGPTHKAGAVAALRGIRNASSVARLVMQRTDHVLLVGEGARRFALAHGFKEQELLTDQARQSWLKWKETLSDQDSWLSPPSGEPPSEGPGKDAGLPHGTITCLALTAGGDLGGCTSTSGIAFKIAGRVGDSPIIGAGLYVDNEVGACGSVGRGEANLVHCSCFLVVELMRNGVLPAEACRRVLRRIAAKTEPRLRAEDGQPGYSLRLYALRKDGLVGAAAMRGEGKMAVHDGTECRLISFEGVFPALPQRRQS